MKRTSVQFGLALLVPLFLFSNLVIGSPTIAEKTRGMQEYEGFLKFYWEKKSGKVWLELDRLEEGFLFVSSMATGIGSNDIGLDRTQLGSQRIVHFERRGPKVFLVQPNLMYRAEETNDPLERRTVQDGFAESVLWAFKIEAEEDSRLLIDLTDMLLQDHRGIAERLKAMNEGQFSFDSDRSAVYLPRTRNFPDNSEFEITVTLRGSRAGSELRSVLPASDTVTVRQHHSLIRLPEPYAVRPHHVMSGYIPLVYRDYTAPIGEDITRRLIRRHRLEKQNPRAEVSEPVEPIVYYLDPGAPEPVRSALIEGGNWWNEAFEAAGFRNAFRIEILPEDADPMDVRYNVINWLHRSTRGWSYGSSIVDPRTGEILKGHVNLGSLRVRQDYLIAEALLAPYEDGVPEEDPMLEMALARIRQLSAHEIGHTLGLIHNFAASTNDRASVMDYPHPRLIRRQDGSVDLSEAYDTGIGEWDKLVIRYGYQQLAEGSDEVSALSELLETGYRELGLRFISDGDARPAGGLHPLAHLWDNGEDAVRELDNVLEIRSDALRRFSAANIRADRPMATLEEVLVPLYFLHRYQTEAVAKLVGGAEYNYQMREGWQSPPVVIPAEVQKRAVDSLLRTISPETLRIPDSVLAILPPRPPGYPRHRELFRGYMGPAFDPLAGAEAAAEMTVSLLLNPQRAARLIYFAASDSTLPSLEEVLSRLINSTWKNEDLSGIDAEINRTVSFVVLDNMLGLATSKSSPMQVKAVTHSSLKELKVYLDTNVERDSGQEAANRFAADLIEKYLNDPQKVHRPERTMPPPGSPIGSCPDRLIGATSTFPW